MITKKEKKISNILFSLLVPSTLKIFGYTLLTSIPFLFVSFLNYPRFFLSTLINRNLFGSLILFFYLIVQSLRGIAVIGDFRIFIWTIFFIFLLISSRLFLKYIYFYENKSFLSKKIIRFTFYSFSVYSLVSYISLIIFNDAFLLQDLWLTGSSAAFTSAIPFFGALFLEFDKSKKIELLNIFFILLFTIYCVLCQSRLGLILLILFLIFLLISKLDFEKLKIKKSFLSVIFILIIAATLYQIYSSVIYKNSGLISLYQQTEYSILRSNEDSLNNDLDRIASYKSTYDKFTSDLPNLLFGTGWYSSRVLQIPYYERAREELGLLYNLKENDTISVDSFISVFSDLGLVGFLLFANIYKETTFILWKSKSTRCTKYFFQSLIILHFSCIFIGFQYASLTYWLTFLPYGLLNSQLQQD